ncbi:MAG: xanthine dehydrogenase family protein molybdopterin-binding subunit [Nitrospiraceae bacterium]|nr:xanthine dehydrogenase family protein molybdopterin-binding subunit [Nitrospiraceae bacterium]
MKNLTRREFLKTSLAGAGLTIAAAVTPGGIRLLSLAEAEQASFHPNAYLLIGADESVTVIVNKSEMGQGVYTSLPMIIADELEADWKQVRIAPAPAGAEYKDPVWGMQSTGGSTSIRHMHDALRKAGAAAREMLVIAAARNMQISTKDCLASNGTVRNVKTGKGLSYGKLVAEAAKLEVPQNPQLKKPNQLRYIGKDMARLDVPDKSMGKANFGIDTFVPNMLYATVSRPPQYGATAASFDKAAAEKVPGVRLVTEISRGIAICADSIDAAWKGKAALNIAWQNPAMAALSTATIEGDLVAKANDTGIVAASKGDATAALGTAAKKIQSFYLLPYLSHATMEPMNCTASVAADKCEVWAPTQNQGGVQTTAAKITGLTPEQVFVHTTFLGGGFGRRFEQDFVEEAVSLSKAAGRPVKLIWTREEDLQHDYYRPANYTRIEAGLDAKGRIVAWNHKIVCPSIFARVFPGTMKNGIDNAAVEGLPDFEYDVPNFRAEYVRIDLPVPVGFWRSVGASHNGFIIESFVDELAAAAGKDPLEFRLAHLKDHPRARRVLETAAKKAGWGKPPKLGQAMGIAYHLSFDSYVAHVAEASVDKATGRITVHRISTAVDCGSVINPDTVKAQMESGIIMGLSAALKEKMEFAKGGVKSQNFGDYELLRMEEIPEIDVDIVASGDKLGGIGEPGVPPTAPAVANAVFKATGVRLWNLPMTPETVKAAMAK